jgi:outer membrane receptor protein involved in Fe transport
MAIKKLLVVISMGAASAALVSPSILHAQAALEEIIVTAQRRVQTLQEVPISIETYSGAEILEQGYRNMEDISTFSPGVYIQSGVQDQQVTVRGFGTIGNSLTLEQAVPIFLDGIHYGRQSQIKTAFLDVDRVEILKGPQPVFFGQSASAGAFNIRSKGPTPEWEGDMNIGLANNGSMEGKFGAGGPLTDTFGVRLALTHEESDGYLVNAVTQGKYPRYFYQGARLTTLWEPVNNLQVLAKLEGAKLRNGSEAVQGCLTEGTMVHGRNGPFNASTGAFINPPISPITGTPEGRDQAVWADPPKGVGMDIPHLPIPTECFKGNVALSAEGPYFKPPDNITEQENNRGFLDVRKAAEGFTSTENVDGLGIAGLDSRGILGKDITDTWAGNLNLIYALDNGIEANWLTGYNYYYRVNVRDNRYTPFFTNYQGREENFHQWSSELRFTSASGGTIEWMGGLSWQWTEKDNYSSSLRPNVRRGQRFNYLWEDVTWLNAFATVTFNFMDDRASLDVGARASKINKEVYVTGYGSNWVYDVQPVSLPASQYYQISAADARIFDPTADLTNLWTTNYNGTRNTPVEWYPSRAAAVGLAAPDFTARLCNETVACAPVTEEFSDTFIDPTVTLRYRVNGDHSLFARYAQASKAAGYDTGQTSIPEDIDEMRFEAETGRTFEVGSKGNFWDGRARYDFTLFRTDFIDLQLSGLAPLSDADSTSISLNAGKQRVQGLEFAVQAAVTENLRLGLSGALMDGKMVEFNGSGCNQTELFNTLLNLNVPGVLPCDVANGEITDRSGTQAPRTPDWKFVGDIRYWLPVFDNYEFVFIGKGYVSDGFVTDRSGFASIVKFNRHGDANLQLQFGPQDNKWKVSTYANNIFQARQSYNPEFDLAPNGLTVVEVNKSYYMSYGMRFGYSF